MHLKKFSSVTRTSVARGTGHYFSRIVAWSLKLNKKWKNKQITTETNVYTLNVET